MKITKKQKKIQRSLLIQKRRVKGLESYIEENLEPKICPVNHFFADGVCCREFFMEAGTVITGVEYKKEIFWILAKGRLRLVEGDHERDIEQGQLMKNRVGTKNAWYSFEDCLIYGFIPTDSKNVLEIMQSVSAEPAETIQGMGANRQELNFNKAIANENQHH